MRYYLFYLSLLLGIILNIIILKRYYFYLFLTIITIIYVDNEKFKTLDIRILNEILFRYYGEENKILLNIILFSW